MAELDTLLEAAKAAQPGDRIQWRDPISACGAEAIPAMTEWIRDAKLGAFAVTVLERIAADSAHRSHVIRTLQAANHDQLPAPVARDVADALNRIPGGTSRRPGGTGGKRSASSETWPGDRPVTALELRFHEAMLNIYTRAGEATRRHRADGTVARGYWATYFLRAVRRHGGPAYARDLLRLKGTTAGFQRLKEEGRLDITMEALVLQPEYAALFTDDDRRIAEQRLKAAGYHPPATSP